MKPINSYEELQKFCLQLRHMATTKVLKSEKLSGNDQNCNIWLYPYFNTDLIIESGVPATRLMYTCLIDGRNKYYMVLQELGLLETKVPHSECDQFLWRKSLDNPVKFDSGAATMAQRIQLIGGFEKIAENLIADRSGRRCVLPLVRPEDVEISSDCVMPSIMCWTLTIMPSNSYGSVLWVTQMQRASDLANLEENFFLIAALAEAVLEQVKKKADKTFEVPKVVRLGIMTPYAYQVTK